MRVQHMREYVRLTQTLSFTQTAREFSVTQPVLSKHIANLEQVLGTQLIVRSQQGISLTKAGEAFAEEAKGIVVEYDAAMDRVQQSKTRKAETITIGYLAGASKLILPPAVEAFAQSHPDVALRFISLEIDEILDALEASRIDLGITTSFSDETPDPTKFTWSGLYPDSFALLVPEGHRLFDRKSICLSELKGEALLLSAPSFMSNDPRARRILEPLRDHAAIHANAYDVDATLTLMQTGRYIALSLGHFKNLLDEGYAYIPIEGFAASMSIGAIWKRERGSATLTAFADELRRRSDMHHGNAFLSGQNPDREELGKEVRV